MLIYVIGDSEDKTEGYPAELTARLNEIDVNIGITALRVDGPGTWAERAAATWARQRHKEIYDHGWPRAVIIARMPECVRSQKPITRRQLQEEGNQVWKEALRGQTRGLLDTFKAMFESRHVIWIHNPDATPQ